MRVLSRYSPPTLSGIHTIAVCSERKFNQQGGNERIYYCQSLDAQHPSRPWYHRMLSVTRLATVKTQKIYTISVLHCHTRRKCCKKKMEDNCSGVGEEQVEKCWPAKDQLVRRVSCDSSWIRTPLPSGPIVAPRLRCLCLAWTDWVVSQSCKPESFAQEVIVSHSFSVLCSNMSFSGDIEEQNKEVEVDKQNLLCAARTGNVEIVKLLVLEHIYTVHTDPL